MDLSKWVEVVGITAVVISLVFVGIELRQNTATNAAQAMLELSVAYSDREMSRIENKELSEIIRVGHSDPEALVPDQKVRYEGYLYSTASLAEAAMTFHRYGVMDDDQYSPWRNSLCSYLDQPGQRAFWNQLHVKEEFTEYYVQKIVECKAKEGS